jgi:hypothetical protein
MCRCLGSLYLQGNPLSESKQYRSLVINIVPSLVKLDGEVIVQRKKLYKSSIHGYEGMFVDSVSHGKTDSICSPHFMSPKKVEPGLATVKTLPASTVESTPGEPNKICSVKSLHLGASSTGTAIQRTISRVSEHYFDGNGVAYDASTGFSVSSPSLYPWRDPPHPLPRPWKGKHVVGSPLPRPAPGLSPRQRSMVASAVTARTTTKSIRFRVEERTKPDSGATARSPSSESPKRRESFKEFKNSVAATHLLTARAKERGPASTEEQWLSPSLSRNAPGSATSSPEIAKLIVGLGLPANKQLRTECWSRRRQQQQQQTVGTRPKVNKLTGKTYNIPNECIIVASEAPMETGEKGGMGEKVKASPLQHDDGAKESLQCIIETADVLETHLTNLRGILVKRAQERRQHPMVNVADAGLADTATVSVEGIQDSCPDYLSLAVSDNVTVTAEYGHSAEKYRIQGALKAPMSSLLREDDALAAVSSPAAKPLVESLKLLKAKKLNMIRTIEAASSHSIS